MEKRKAQIRSPFTRRASSNDSYDGNPSSSQGIQLIHRTSSYDFINGTITHLNQSSSSSTEDYPPSLEARTLNQLPYLSSNKRYRKSVSTAARRFCPRPIFSLIILLFIIGSLFFFFGVDLDTIERAIGLKDGKSLRSSTLKHHGSVLQEFGKSDEVKVKLKNKDKITKRDMVIIGENQVKKIVEIIDGKRYESEELSDFHTKPKWKNLSDFGQVPNLRGANDDLLVQLVKDRKQKLSEKLQDNQDVLNHPPPSSLPPSAHDVMDLDQMRQQIDTLIRKIRFMKEHDRTVMETNATARHAIQELQGKLRPYLLQKYGSSPYRVEMQLHFPASMETKGKMEDTIVIQLAPIDLVPYSVFYFLQVLENWKGGAFHRRAGHVLQAMVSSRIPSLAFQEYHKAYPHVKFTLGYAGIWRSPITAGRPGGPEFYISTLDNTYNHGPGSQGSKTEADSCFGKIVEGLEVVKRMQSQPGAGPSGFINDPQNFIRITSLKLLPPT